MNSEKAFLLKIMPLFIKNIAMKAVFNAVGGAKAAFAYPTSAMRSCPSLCAVA